MANFVKVPLTKGQVAIIDAEDVLLICTHKWQFNSGYACRSSYIKGTGHKGKYRYLKMHRVIMRNPKEQVDHINGDKLDNRKANLRLATPSQNKANGFYRDSKSGYKGVYLRPNRRRGFQAAIRHEGKLYYLGSFFTSSEGALAYNKKALELFGRFARLNEVPGV